MTLLSILILCRSLCDKLDFVSDIMVLGGVLDAPWRLILVSQGLCVCVCLHKSTYHYLSVVISYSKPTDLILFLNQIMPVCWKLRQSPGGTETGTAPPTTPRVLRRDEMGRDIMYFIYLHYRLEVWGLIKAAFI